MWKIARVMPVPPGTQVVMCQAHAGGGRVPALGVAVFEWTSGDEDEKYVPIVVAKGRVVAAEDYAGVVLPGCKVEQATCEECESA